MSRNPRSRVLQKAAAIFVAQKQLAMRCQKLLQTHSWSSGAASGVVPKSGVHPDDDRVGIAGCQRPAYKTPEWLAGGNVLSAKGHCGGIPGDSSKKSLLPLECMEA